MTDIELDLLVSHERVEACILEVIRVSPFLCRLGKSEYNFVIEKVRGSRSFHSFPLVLL